MKESLDPENPKFVTDKARDSVSGFLSQVMDLIKDTPHVCVFGMVTQVEAHFPDLVVFLDECVVTDVSCHAAEVNIPAFLFHLETLKVSCLKFLLLYYYSEEFFSCVDFCLLSVAIAHNLYFSGGEFPPRFLAVWT